MVWKQFGTSFFERQPDLMGGVVVVGDCPSGSIGGVDFRNGNDQIRVGTEMLGEKGHVPGAYGVPLAGVGPEYEGGEPGWGVPVRFLGQSGDGRCRFGGDVGGWPGRAGRSDAEEKERDKKDSVVHYICLWLWSWHYR